VHRILVIDDEDPIRANVARLLRLEGFEVVTAADGAEGIAALQTQLPDLVLCDVVMPDTNGYAVFDALRTISGAGRVPFIFITASAHPQEREQCLKRGASAYLAKPFNLRDVLATVRECLGLT
jgi:CheY-like chemotaxis protein